MLKITRIRLTNFGPFKGDQAIELPDDGGVAIVYGENMRGKTTLLNAIRYAFFGKVIGRGSRQLALHKVGNWESAEAGEYGFKVILEFTYGERPYELTRHCRLREGVTTPQSDDDYLEETFLRRDGDVLGPEQMQLELAQILPEKVSRFFLFDGELLQEYEELLRDESDMGRQIKEAIERILGVPVLTNGRADLSLLVTEAQRTESRAAQRDQRTRELGNQHARLLELREHHQSELQRLQGELEGRRNEKKATDEALRKRARIKGLLQERDSLEDEVAAIEARLTEKKNARREALTNAWQWLLKEKTDATLGDLQRRVDELRAVDTRRAVATELLGRAEAALGENRCYACKQDLKDDARQSLEGSLESLRAAASEEGSSAELEACIQQLAVLKEVQVPDKTDLLKQILLDIEDLRIQRAAKRDKISDINDQTRNLDESEIRRLSSEHDRLVQDITILESGIRQEQAKITETNADIQRVQQQLDRIAGADLARERQRRDLCQQLHSLLNEGVGIYRERLRTRVQDDASALFRQLTTEPEYETLRINENYGLTIIHQEGSAIEVRSAGAEHIVALALMGALQKNAPLRGPIIMDSPFGRLDRGHTTRVLRTLPNMAGQVLLLVYESEIDPGLARNELQGQLKREYRIQRQSARHSNLTPYTEN